MKCYQSSYTSYASSAAALQEPREGLGAVQQAHLFYWPSVVRVDSETIIFLHFCILSRLGLLAAHFYCAIYSVSKVEIASEMNQTGVVKGVGKTNCRLLSTMVTTSVGSEPAIAPACLSSPRSSRDAWIRKCARVCVEQGLINRIYIYGLCDSTATNARPTPANKWRVHTLQVRARASVNSSTIAPCACDAVDERKPQIDRFQCYPPKTKYVQSETGKGTRTNAECRAVTCTN